MLTGRSQPGPLQVRCLALSSRHCEGETERLAQPTSTTAESAFRIRCNVPSHARRCTVLLEIGIPFPSCDAAAPSSPFRPSIVVLTLICGRNTVAPRQGALVHGLIDDFNQRVGSALFRRPPVGGARALGTRFDGRLQGGAAHAVEHARAVDYAAGLADA